MASTDTSGYNVIMEIFKEIIRERMRVLERLEREIFKAELKLHDTYQLELSALRRNDDINRYERLRRMRLKDFLSSSLKIELARSDRRLHDRMRLLYKRIFYLETGFGVSRFQRYLFLSRNNDDNDYERLSIMHLRSFPSSLVTDRDNGEVYVCDCEASKIQVFDEDGNYQRSIIQEGLSDTHSIAITSEYLFVCVIPNTILQIDKLSGNIMSTVTPEDDISCITADVDKLYAGLFYTNGIIHLSLQDMRIIRVTSLDSPYIRRDTRLRDLKVIESEFVVLFNYSDKPVQIFSKKGYLIGVIASKGELERPYYLCVDRRCNIFVSDRSANNIKVFSTNGYFNERCMRNRLADFFSRDVDPHNQALFPSFHSLYTIIGHEGTRPGEFYHPMGIDIDKYGRIVVVDNKDTHQLQFF